MFSRLLPEMIALDVLLAEGLPMIEGDSGQIDQVIINLVVNARDAMPSGGHLTVKTYLQSEKELAEGKGLTVAKSGQSSALNAADLLLPGPAVIMEIADTGVGMDAKIRAHIFEPFFTTKPEDKGTGLGLATSYGIVSRHGGRIDVSSELGKGTTFRVLFPVGQQVPDSTAEEHGTDVSLAPSLRIMVVEDEVEVRNFTSLALEKHGYIVTAMSTPAEALQVLGRKDELFDLLLTDIVMPGMSGTGLWEQATRLQPELKILFMTGYADVLVDNPQIQQLPVLAKRFTLGELLDAVARAAAAVGTTG